MEIFRGKQTEEMGDWISIEKELPTFQGGNGKVAIKINDTDSTHAFFCEDMCAWVAPILKPSYFWHCKTHEPIRGVTHFKYLKEKEQNDQNVRQQSPSKEDS